MSTPALQRLRDAKPDAEITLLCPVKLADLWRHHPSVDRVITFANGENVWKVGSRLRAENFRIALVFPNSIRSALEVWWARVPRRIGYPRPWRKVLLTQRVAPRVGAANMRKRSASEIKTRIQQGGLAERYPVSAHHFFDYLNLVSVLGANPEPIAPQLVVTDGEIKAVRERFGVAADELRPLCGLNPGAEYGPAKRWPAERFIAAAQQIHQRVNCRWLILGGKSDVPLASEIAAGISQSAGVHQARVQRPDNVVMNLAGVTNLRELCVLLKICEVLLTNDSGPMHIAAAFGTSVVVPFGSTSPELTGPGLPGDTRHTVLRADVPCAPCFRRECPIDFRCMHGISVEAVVESVLRLIRH